MFETFYSGSQIVPRIRNKGSCNFSFFRSLRTKVVTSITVTEISYLSNKTKITFFEYILLIWLISIQIERMKKFAAMANKPRAEKIKLLKKDKWNAVYLLAFLTCLGMILLRGAPTQFQFFFL